MARPDKGPGVLSTRAGSKTKETDRGGVEARAPGEESVTIRML